MESPTSTAHIVQSLTRSIVEHRLQPGAKLGEQKLADHFGVSRTVVRQALFQLSQHHLIKMEPSRGAFVAVPSVAEAQQVFEVRRMLELEMTRNLARQITPSQIKTLQAHVAQEQRVLRQHNAPEQRTELLGDFHVRMAELSGNHVLAGMLRDLIARCSLITLMYQSSKAAQDSSNEHEAIVAALAARDEALAVRLMQAHLSHVMDSLMLNKNLPTSDIASALA